MAIRKRFFTGPCLILKISAIISLDPLNAVSPEVIGHATTPRTARNAPNAPKSWTEDLFTTTAGEPTAASYFIPPNTVMAAAAHINATTPSAIIAP